MYSTARATSPLRWLQASYTPLPDQFELPGYVPLPPPKPLLTSVAFSLQPLPQLPYGSLPRLALNVVSDRYSMCASVYGEYGWLLASNPFKSLKPCELGQVCSRL